MTVLDIRGPIGRAAIPSLCTRLALLLDESPGDIVCDVEGVTSPDAVAVDALARLKLLAGCRGREMRVTGACDRLVELVSLMGLDEVLRVEPRR